MLSVDGSGAAAQLTSTGTDFGPAWSPDGMKIAFTFARDLYAVRADGADAPVNLTNTPTIDERQPSYTSDGSRLAYAAVNGKDPSLSGIYLMNAGGTGVTFTGVHGSDPDWKPGDFTDPTPTPTPDPSPSPSPTPTPQADLSVLLAASPNRPAVGNALTYTLRVTNEGPDTAPSVGAFFTRPQGFDLVSVTTAAGSCQQTPAAPLGTTCQLGDIPSGAPVSVNFVTRPTAAGEFTALSSAVSAVDDPVQNNNVQSLPLTVAPPAPCVEEVTSSVVRTIERPGNQSRKQLRHVIYVQNTSGRRLNGLVHFVFDGLPASVEGDKGMTFFRTRCAEPLGRKYTTVGVNQLVWEPGHVIRLEVDFFNPDRELVNYNLRIYTGPGYP
ncbi:MAG: DUF11 domain-containing protein [Acidobacteria bacterium]|nr:DUF11 domain-containing protein [Acidobacteriota bacterium]